jgi:hypothetical protein
VLAPTAATAAESKKPAEGAGGAPQKIAGEQQLRAIPMYVRVDMIDPATRTFSLKRKDGVLIKHVVPAEAEVKQGPVAAKLEDIKIGDYVSGSRRKVSETEYTVVKITKFGPPAKK